MCCPTVKTFVDDPVELELCSYTNASHTIGITVFSLLGNNKPLLASSAKAKQPPCQPFSLELEKQSVISASSTWSQYSRERCEQTLPTLFAAAQRTMVSVWTSERRRRTNVVVVVVVVERFDDENIIELDKRGENCERKGESHTSVKTTNLVRRLTDGTNLERAFCVLKR